MNDYGVCGLQPNVATLRYNGRRFDPGNKLAMLSTAILRSGL
jgi:hypothetical protein